MPGKRLGGRGNTVNQPGPSIENHGLFRKSFENDGYDALSTTSLFIEKYCPMFFKLDPDFNGEEILSKMMGQAKYDEIMTQKGSVTAKDLTGVDYLPFIDSLKSNIGLVNGILNDVGILMSQNVEFLDSTINSKGSAIPLKDFVSDIFNKIDTTKDFSNALPREYMSLFAQLDRKNLFLNNLYKLKKKINDKIDKEYADLYAKLEANNTPEDEKLQILLAERDKLGKLKGDLFQDTLSLVNSNIDNRSDLIKERAEKVVRSFQNYSEERMQQLSNGLLGFLESKETPKWLGAIFSKANKTKL